jgi:hypothetical protein
MRQGGHRPVDLSHEVHLYDSLELFWSRLLEGSLPSATCQSTEEPFEGGDEAIGALYVGHVTAVWDDGKRTFLEASECVSCLSR